MQGKEYSFYTCNWLPKDGQCSPKAGTLAVSGTIDLAANTLTYSGKELALGSECGQFAVPSLGFFGSVSLYASGSGYVCNGIFGEQSWC